MPMLQVADYINKALHERSDCYYQGREKEHAMNRNAEADCERHQQSCRRRFQGCEQHFFYNASFVNQSIVELRSPAIIVAWL